MKKTLKDKLSERLVNAFLKNKIIAAIPKKITKKLTEADKFRKLCESKIKEPVIGYKAGGTGIPLLKKLNEKEPFYASVYKHNVLKNHRCVKINKYTMGIELEVCYLIKSSFFVNFLGIAEIILFFKKALTNLSENLSFNVFFIKLFYFNTDIGSSLV